MRYWIRIYSDQKKLRQLLINLQGNAFKFTRQGHVRLSVGRIGEKLSFTVADTGCGIAPEEMPKLFRVFSQTHEGRHSSEGTELGLAICKGFVEGRGFFQLRYSIIGIGSGGVKLLIADDQFENRLFLKRFLTKLGVSIVEAVDGQHAMELVAKETPVGILMDIRMPVMDGIEATRALRQQGYDDLSRSQLISTSYWSC